ncbi:MAG: hypothetical protein WBD02_10240, partial [Acidimicrobiia bacterium]
MVGESVDVRVFETNPEEVNWPEVVSSGAVLVNTGPFAREHVLRAIEHALHTENVTPDLLVGALAEGHADVNAAIGAELETALGALSAATDAVKQEEANLE